jgi:hypothetical protein
MQVCVQAVIPAFISLKYQMPNLSLTLLSTTISIVYFTMLRPTGPTFHMQFFTYGSLYRSTLINILELNTV